MTMHTKNLNELGLVPFDLNKIGINEVYDIGVSPVPEKVREVLLLKDGKLVCQWLNGTVSYVVANRLAMKEIGI